MAKKGEAIFGLEKLETDQLLQAANIEIGMLKSEIDELKYNYDKKLEREKDKNRRLIAMVGSDVVRTSARLKESEGRIANLLKKLDKERSRNSQEEIDSLVEKHREEIRVWRTKCERLQKDLLELHKKTHGKVEIG